MKKKFDNGLSSQNRLLWEKIQKLHLRIQHKITNRSFYKLNRKKQQHLLKAFHWYSQRLAQAGLSLKKTTIAGTFVLSLVKAVCVSTSISLAIAGTFVLSLAIGNTATAQTFTEQTGAANPFNGVGVGSKSKPVFVDIDNDGDFDAFIGEYQGTINYYKNTGSNVSPIFTVQTGAANPFNGVDVGFQSAPAFVDIDNDGDFDAFIGEGDGTINYYENTGSNVSPIFTAQTGTTNPFNNVDVGSNSTPVFVDIDNDGDFDAFIGEKISGNIYYYKNTGSNGSPIFTAQTGAANPFNGVSVGGFSAPAFVDIDNDGDFDAFIGEGNGTIMYYKNTGSNVSPIFTAQTGAANPFDVVDVGLRSIPAFVDIDNDGDFDAFIGEENGTINFYENAPVALPVEMTNFDVAPIENVVEVTWQTASERNNEGFEVQRSAGGQEWQTLGFVKGNGTTLETQNYTYTDESPLTQISYYRLKQIDFDGQFEYSNILSVKTKVFGEEIKIYPNPVQDKLTITNTKNIENIVIYNALGQLLRQFTINNSQLSIDVSDLPKGIYTLKVQDINGVITTQQFLK
jgi:hypothetical protein